MVPPLGERISIVREPVSNCLFYCQQSHGLYESLSSPELFLHSVVPCNRPLNLKPMSTCTSLTIYYTIPTLNDSDNKDF